MYAVNDGTLILFEGANEKDATFAGAYELKNLSMNLVGTTTDNITTTTKITQKINNGLIVMKLSAKPISVIPSGSLIMVLTE